MDTNSDAAQVMQLRTLSGHYRRDGDNLYLDLDAAADTIERLTKERDRLLAAQTTRQPTTILECVIKERDGLKAEVDRSQQLLHKAEQDRESLLAEVERLKGAMTLYKCSCGHSATYPFQRNPLYCHKCEERMVAA